MVIIKQVRGMGGIPMLVRGLQFYVEWLWDISGDVLFGQSPEGGEGVNCEDIWGERISGKAGNRWKAPELRMCLECSRYPQYPILSFV